MTFADETLMRPMRQGDMRCWLDRMLCRIFHGDKFWRVKYVEDVGCVIECVKCDFRWRNT